MFLDTIIKEINSNIIYHKDEKYENVSDYLIGILSTFKYFTLWVFTINIFYLNGYFQEYYNSILFLKLEDIKETKINNLNNNELRNKIINQKKNELYNLYSKSHLSKLRNTSFIEYK